MRIQLYLRLVGLVASTLTVSVFADEAALPAGTFVQVQRGVVVLGGGTGALRRQLHLGQLKVGV